MKLIDFIYRFFKKNNEVLFEMARIGFAENDKNQQELEIRVYTEPLGNPSFHVISKRYIYEVVLQITDLKIIEWKYNKKKLKDIPKIDKEDIIKFFKSERIKDELSMWKYFVLIWNDHNNIKLKSRDKPEWLKE